MSKEIDERQLQATLGDLISFQSFSEGDINRRVENRFEALAEHLVDVEYAVAERIVSLDDSVRVGKAIRSREWQDRTGNREQGIDAGHCIFGLTYLNELPFPTLAKNRLDEVGLCEAFKEPLKRTNIIPVLLNQRVEWLIEDGVEQNRGRAGREAQSYGVRRLLHEQPKGRSVNPLLLQSVFMNEIKPKTLNAVDEAMRYVDKQLPLQIVEQLKRKGSYENSIASRVAGEWALEATTPDIRYAARDRYGRSATTQEEVQRRVSKLPILARRVLGDYADAINRYTEREFLKPVDRRIARITSSRKRLQR